MRSLNTINTACLTPPFDDPISLTEQILAIHSVFNVGFIDLLQYEQHEALYRDRVYIVALGKTTTYVAFLYHSSSASASVSALLPHRTINGVIHHRPPTRQLSEYNDDTTHHHLQGEGGGRDRA